MTIDLKALREEISSGNHFESVGRLLSELLDRLEAAEKSLAEPAVLSVGDSTVLSACQKLAQTFSESPPPPAEVPMLSDDEIDEVWNGLIATPDFSRVKIARAVEHLVRRKAGL